MEGGGRWETKKESQQLTPATLGAACNNCTVNQYSQLLSLGWRTHQQRLKCGRQWPRTPVTPAGPCPPPPFNPINMDPVYGTHMSQTHCTQTNEYASNKKNPLLQQQLCQSLVAISFLISLLVLSMIDAMEREHWCLWWSCEERVINQSSHHITKLVSSWIQENLNTK